MRETYFSLADADKAELFEKASSESGRPAYLFEKDVWVVWVLEALFTSSLGNSLTFKGGTSLSKVYKVIDRFSEDIDITYDIRSLLRWTGEKEWIPKTPSEAKTISKKVRDLLPSWVNGTVCPILNDVLKTNSIDAELRQGGDVLFLDYPKIVPGHGYISQTVKLEFGARSTGEPIEYHHVKCDLEPLIPEIIFPGVELRAMKMERTFWEKATAIHVFCCQGRLRGDRFSRHWYDLVCLASDSRMLSTLADQSYLAQVVQHKNVFFREKKRSGEYIDYGECMHGQLHLVPTGESLKNLQHDYRLMKDGGILNIGAPDFDYVLSECEKLQVKINDCFRNPK